MPGFDGTGPTGMGPITGRGLGHCIVPIENSPGYTRLGMPYAASYAACRRPFGPLSYGFNPLGVVPYRFSSRGGRGRRSWARGRSFGFFGRGQGTGRRWW